MKLDSLRMKNESDCIDITGWAVGLRLKERAIVKLKLVSRLGTTVREEADKKESHNQELPRQTNSEAMEYDRSYELCH